MSTHSSEESDNESGLRESIKALQLQCKRINEVDKNHINNNKSVIKNDIIDKKSHIIIYLDKTEDGVRFLVLNRTNFDIIIPNIKEIKSDSNLDEIEEFRGANAFSVNFVDIINRKFPNYILKSFTQTYIKDNVIDVISCILNELESIPMYNIGFNFEDSTFNKVRYDDMFKILQRYCTDTTSTNIDMVIPTINGFMLRNARSAYIIPEHPVWDILKNAGVKGFNDIPYTKKLHNQIFNSSIESNLASGDNIDFEKMKDKTYDYLVDHITNDKLQNIGSIVSGSRFIFTLFIKNILNNISKILKNGYVNSILILHRVRTILECLGSESLNLIMVQILMYYNSLWVVNLSEINQFITPQDFLMARSSVDDTYYLSLFSKNVCDGNTALEKIVYDMKNNTHLYDTLFITNFQHTYISCYSKNTNINSVDYKVQNTLFSLANTDDF